jgi:hypothetical protein
LHEWVLIQQGWNKNKQNPPDHGDWQIESCPFVLKAMDVSIHILILIPEFLGGHLLSGELKKY